MDDLTHDSEDRMRALGQVRISAGARDATRALTMTLDDPAVRDAIAPEPRRRFAGLSRRHRLVVGSLVALLGIGVGVPAVATSLLARTGEFGDPATSTEVDDTEWIDPGADDLPQVIIDAYPDYLTLPPGMPENMAIADTSRLMGRMGAEHEVGQAVVQEGYVTQVYETFAICAWTDVWLGAHASSDAAAEALATAWIGDFDNYRAVSSSVSIRDRMTVIAQGAAAGNPGIVKGTYTENDCAVRLGDAQ
ncbi:hypothetical protein E3T55_16535 [Cryobacterium frigoriphilum]|uniref:Uncharacterized protein n=1 Tax=Cryobacterium frigoriphilum TaxID=1259150 RepID=A0A4R8ZVA6_9MICO|nr:hypothetical protein [Cryobacterium frigoriphilum]TFD46976.1 hypothetical protein E3T55_16535 [Cryobacterium frigoriphilum]